MPLRLFPHRFWVFLSIPLAMLASYGYLRIEERFNSHRKFILAAMIAGVLITSYAGKVSVQTAIWPPGGGFASPQDEISGYMVMKKSLPAGTKVFPVCGDDSKIIAFDMISEPYVPEYELFTRGTANRTAAQTYAFLKQRNYPYAVFTASCVRPFGKEKTQALVSDYLSSGLYEPVYQNPGFLILKIK